MGQPNPWTTLSKPAAAGLLLRARAGTDRQTDGRTPYRFIYPAPHTMRAVRINQHSCVLGYCCLEKQRARRESSRRRRGSRASAFYCDSVCIYTAQRRRRKQHLSSLSDVADRRPNDRLNVCLLSYLTFPSLPRASSHPATGLYRGAIVQFIIHVNRNENDRAKVVRDVS